MALADKLKQWAPAWMGFGEVKAEVARHANPHGIPHAPRANVSGSGHYEIIGGYHYDGQKDAGEMPIKNYVVNYPTLRQRSWDLLLDSPLAQTVIKKYVSWSIGKGLKLQAEPSISVLAEEGITIKKEEWSKRVESRFELFKRSKGTDYSGMQSLNKLESEAFKNAKIGGDVLVLLYYKKGRIKVQLVDGARVATPLNRVALFPMKEANGNRIKEGIEIDDSGEHQAYHIKRPGASIETDRIAARDAQGRIRAYMVYGWKYRIDSVRGMPLLSVVMEMSQQLQQYQAAAVASAEDRAKISVAIEHQPNAMSTGDNPFATSTVRALNVSGEFAPDFPEDSFGQPLADKVTATTKRQAVNLPLGAALKTIESKAELYFKDFFTVNIDQVCAACEIPPNVAMSKYDSNFSASRAALKEWDNTLNVQREDFAEQFLAPIYAFFLEMETRTGKIKSPGYVEAFDSEDWMLLEAYHKSRFVGVPVPHIDPVKEVDAERKKLGKAADAIPLTTIERATEILGGGDSDGNIEQFSEELKLSRTLGIKLEDTLPKPAAGAAPAPAKKKIKKK